MKSVEDKLGTFDRKQLLALALNVYRKNSSDENPIAEKHEKEEPVESDSLHQEHRTIDIKAKGPLFLQVLAAPTSLKKRIISNAINEIITSVVGLEHTIGVHDPLDQTGLDSLMALEVREQISKALGIELDAGIVYNFSCVDAIADHLLDLIDGSESISESPHSPQSTEEPVAVIGMSCRFPGGCNTIEEYWEMLLEGRDCITEMKDERWDMSSFFNPDPQKPGKMYSKWSGLLDNVKGFDAGFFGVSEKEAENMDPLQRILLEVAWEAIENAGYSSETLKGNKGGIFVGAVNSEYATLQGGLPDEDLNGYMGTGNATSIIAGRIAYLLGFEGPTMVVDTACSSSLVSIDLACKNLRDGSANIALAGGINLNLTPKTNIILSKAMMLSPDGRCKTFDHKANGYVRSEGCGLVVLKRLSDAVRDGDDIVAIVQGSAVNQDGRSQGLTAPNGLAQEKILKTVLSSTGINEDNINYLEAHGTGTALGDPIEIHAIHNVYSDKRQNDQKLYVGSVKSNIGHSEAAAGIASFIKSALITKHRIIPPSLHVEKLNPLLDFDKEKIEIVEQTTSLDHLDDITVGVSSFGMSGTNCHMILSSYKELTEDVSTPKDSDGCSPQLLTLSAKTPDGLLAVLKANLEYIRHADIDLQELSYTSNIARDHFSTRFVQQVTSRSQIIHELTNEIENLQNSNLRSQPTVSKNITFAFSGQGSQFSGMGQTLYKTNAVFRQHIDQCDQILATQMSMSLKEVLWGNDTNHINQTQNTQPAIFSLEYALAQMWISFGVMPDVLIGHSIGEISAACIAGVFSLEDALLLVAQRGQLMSELDVHGGMAVVYASSSKVTEFIASYDQSISIAAINGTQNVVISGDQKVLECILNQCKKTNINYKLLDVSHAFHSPLMEPMLAKFRDAISNIHFHDPALPLMSCVTGKLESKLFTDINYWVEHVAKPVQFFDAINQVSNLFPGLALEVGPGATLTSMIRTEADITLDSVVSLYKNKQGLEQTGPALAKLYDLGLFINWKTVYGEWKQNRIKMPNYPFQRKDYWINIPNLASPGIIITQDENTHPLLGNTIKSPQLTFQQTLAISDRTFFIDHKVFDLCVVPGSAYVEIGYALGKELLGKGNIVLSDLYILEPLHFEEGGKKRTIEVHTFQQDENQFGYKVYSCLQQDYMKNDCIWSLHANGKISSSDETHLNTEALDDLQTRIHDEVAVSTLYNALSNIGLQYGPCHQGVKNVYLHETGSLGKIDLRDELKDQDKYLIHPSVLDSCFHQIAIFLNTFHNIDFDIFVPVQFGSVSIYKEFGKEVWCHSEIVHTDNVRIAANFTIYDIEGNISAKIERAEFQKVSYINIITQIRNDNQQWLYRSNWVEKSLSNDETLTNKKVLILSSDDEFSRTLVSTLKQSNFIATVHISSEYRSVDQFEYYVNPEEQAHFIALLNDLAENNAFPEYIINAWPLIETNDATLSERYASHALLNLTQSLVKRQSELKQLSILTRNSQLVGREGKVDPHGSAVWGLAKVIASEQFELNCKKYDLDEQPVNTAIPIFLQDLVADSDVDTVAYRAEKRFTGYLDRFNFPRDKRIEAVTFSRNASYLITGGLGALGLYIAEWMIHKGAKNIVLTSRREPTSVSLSRINLMRNKGVNVVVAIADVSVSADVSHLANQINSTLPPLKGIIHAAGVLDDGILLQQEWHRFEKVYAAKVQGSWNLHSLINNDLLDFTVYFSSAASMLGTPGQGNYAAANSYMDSLAQARSMMGYPSTSINWGPWGEIGMSTSEAVQSRLEKENIVGMMDPHQAMLYLEQTLEALQAGLHLPQVGVMSVNWENLSRSFKDVGVTPFFLDKLIVEVDDSPVEGMEEVKVFLDKIKSIKDKEKLDFVEKFIRQQVSNALGLFDLNEISPTDSLFDIGMDSLMAVDLRNVLSAALGKQIPTTILFEYSTTLQLAEYLLDKMQSDSSLLEDEKEQTHIVEFRSSAANSNELPLFFVHAVGGSVFSYSTLANNVDKNIPFYGIQTIDEDITADTTIEDLATTYITSIKEIQPKGPYRLGGWSMGGFIAYEMARQLTSNGEEVSNVIMLDSVQGEVKGSNSNSEAKLESLMIFAFDLGIPPEMIDLSKIGNQPVEEVIEAFYNIGKDNAILPESMLLETFIQRFSLFNNNMNALLKYVPYSYSGNVTRLVAKDLTMNTKTTHWSDLISNLSSHTVEGNHFTVLKNPHIKDVSAVINDTLRAEHVETELTD